MSTPDETRWTKPEMDEALAAVAQSHHDRAVAEAEREVARLRNLSDAWKRDNHTLRTDRDEARAEVARLAGVVERVESSEFTRAQLREAERVAVLSALNALDDLATDVGYGTALQHTRAAYLLTPATDERVES